MTRPMRPAISVLAAALGAVLLLSILSGGHSAVAQEVVSVLPLNADADGEITTWQPDVWTFRGCVDDEVSLTMASADFAPYLELYGPGDELVLALEAEDDTASVDQQPLTATGVYTVVAAGERRQDRGPYTLNVTFADEEESSDPITGFLTPGITVTGRLAAGGFAAWAFRGCAGETAVVEVASEQFGPAVQLYRVNEPDLLAESSDAGEDGVARIEEVELPQSATYVAVLFGENRSAAGDYSLAVTASGGLAEMADSAVGIVGPTSAQLFDRPGGARLSTVRVGTPVTARGRSADGDWLRVDLPDGVTGWMQASAMAIFGVEALAVVDETAASTSPQPTPSLRPTATPTRTPTRTPTAALPTCTVKTNNLNLRSGPGTFYSPPIGSLALGSQLLMLARDPAATWVEVEVSATGRRGWVSAGAQYVECNAPVASLPIGVIPATPTPPPTATPTNTPSPTPTPTQPVAQAPKPPTEIGIGGGGGSGLAGQIQTDIGIVVDPNGQPTFRDRIYLRMLVYDPTEGNSDGDGIDFVEFAIQQVFPTERDVHYESESDHAFCSFGGNNPCNVLRITPGGRWPVTGEPFENGDYNLDVTVHTDSGGTASWNLFFTIDNPALDSGGNSGGGAPPPSPGGGPLFARIAQTGDGHASALVTDAIVFQVEAYDPAVGTVDGDGIDYVELTIFGPDGAPVYSRRENDPAYCAFQGGEPDCNIWSFASNSGRWPTDIPIRSGSHLLQGRAVANDGRATVVQMKIDIQ